MSQQELLKKIIQALDQAEIPYMITGQMNQHPRAAIKMRNGDNPDDYAAFYDQMIEEE